MLRLNMKQTHSRRLATLLLCALAFTLSACEKKAATDEHGHKAGETHKEGDGHAKH